MTIHTIDPPKQTAADRLKVARLFAGLSQSQAAVAIPMSLRTIQSWECGARKPHPIVLDYVLARLQKTWSGLSALSQNKQFLCRDLLLF